MTWVLCILVPMVHTPRGRSGATFVKALAQSECGQFCHLAFVDPIGIVTTPSGMQIFESQGHGSLCWTPGGIVYGTANPISKPAWRYTIGSTSNFGSFRAAKMTRFWDPNFPLPCGQLAAPFIFAHREPGPNSKLYTQMKVLGPASYPVSHWPYLGRANHAWG